MRNLCFVLFVNIGACASTHAIEPAQSTHVNAASEPAAVGARAAHEAGPTEDSLLPHAREPQPSVVTGGAPSEQQLQAAHAAGYRTVISLLPSTEPESGYVRALGMRFVSIPVAGAQDLTEDNARKLGQAMDGTDAKPLLLHCASGNRAGALLALKAFYVDHASPEEALRLGDAAGLASLRPAVVAVVQGAEPRVK